MTGASDPSEAPRPQPAASPPGPPIITDPQVVERRARDLADQNVRFRAWVKFRCDLDDAALDDIVREAADSVWAHIDCRQCAMCCRVLEPTLDGDDVARLAKRLGMDARAFRRRYAREREGEPVLIARPCPFLRDNDCSVYEDRPKACRDFPYLHSDGFRFRMLGLIGYASLCPIVFNTLEALKRRLPWPRRRKR